MNAQYDAMDDQAEWAQTHWSVCAGNCGQGRQPCDCAPVPPAPAEACTDIGHCTKPAKPGLFRRLYIALRLRHLNWQLACLRDERERYVEAGMVGPIYELNSRTKEIELMKRICNLEIK